MDDEIFTATRIIVKEYNWLEVFKYEKWSENILSDFKQGKNLSQVH